MDAFFVDDSTQRKPERDGMGPLVAAGGVHVPGEEVRPLERALHELCTAVGFPPGEEFKWSPGKEAWLYEGLKFDARRDFYFAALDLAGQHGVQAIVAVEDTSRATASLTAQSAEEDVVTLFLERAHNLARARRTDAIVIADRPGGDRKAEGRFLQTHIERLNRGTEFARLDRLALMVSSDSHLIRLAQLADVVVSCTLSRVAGEARWSPDVFERINPLFRRAFGRAGGIGLKIQPDYTYANLYHWLLGDDAFWRGNNGHPMPLANRPYASSPDTP